MAIDVIDGTRGETGLPAGPEALSRCDLLLDPRHTGVNNLSEFLFLMQLGAIQWQQIARFAGVRLRDFRSDFGNPVYASFYYIRETFPVERPLSSYALDDRLTILSKVRLCGSTVIDGRHLLCGEETPEEQCRSADGEGLEPCDWLPSVRMSNVFVQKQSGPEHLKVVFPANVDLDRFPRVESRPETYELAQRARVDRRFPRPAAAGFSPFGPAAFSFRYEINPDCDINGVGLVYFANYVAFLDMAERDLLRRAGTPEERIDGRSLVEREIAYFGNARSTDVLHIDVEAHRLEGHGAMPVGTAAVHFDYRVRRESDGRLICVSRATKILPE
ncbi:MAG: LnmK family bifunctional acyltransferase/decarboxylase [Thermoanaerobaculia bacterium]